MDFAGTIEPVSDSRPLDPHEWQRLIECRADLVRPAPHEGINPFTRKPITLYPDPNAADLLVRGQRTGSFGWAENEENAIIVWGELNLVRPFADEIAESLGGRFVPADESAT